VDFLMLAVETPSSTIIQRSLIGYMANIITPASICDGSLLGLIASSSYWWQDISPQPTYSWERPNGQTIDGPSELDVPNTTAADAGRYILTTTFGANCNYAAIKDTVYINYGLEAPKLMASQGVIASGSSVTLTATNCPTFSPYDIVWSNQMTGKSIVVAPTITTTYRATCKANNCTSNPSDPLTITVLNQPLADVALRMRTNRRLAKVGEPISVTITAVNEGTTTVSDLQIMSRLPASIGIADLGNMQALVDGVQGVITSLVPGGRQELVFAVQQQLPGTSRLAAQITASTNPDPDSWPNSGTNDGQDDVVWVDLRTEETGGTYSSPEPNPAILPTVQQTPSTLPDGFADLGLTMALSNRSPTVGDVISISLTLTNDQSSRMLTPVIRCTLPEGISFLAGNGISANGQEVTVAGGIYFCFPALTFSFQVQVNATGSKTIFTEIQSCDWPDPDSSHGNGYLNGEDDTAQVELRVR
jgi:trimeric autotransporter adhesin